MAKRPAVVSIGERTFVGRDGFKNWQEDMDTITAEAKEGKGVVGPAFLSHAEAEEAATALTDA